MRATSLLAAACIMAATLPAFAADSMPMMSMMKAGETVAIMPDGHMGTMMSDAMAGDSMMKMAQPMDHCMMMMMGKDGKMYMVDTSSADSMKECEKMAK
jgi:hypothetical protein